MKNNDFSFKISNYLVYYSNNGCFIVIILKISKFVRRDLKKLLNVKKV
jgi:hypothetical protein